MKTYVATVKLLFKTEGDPERKVEDIILSDLSSVMDWGFAVQHSTCEMPIDGGDAPVKCGGVVRLWPREVDRDKLRQHQAMAEAVDNASDEDYQEANDNYERAFDEL